MQNQYISSEKMYYKLNHNYLLFNLFLFNPISWLKKSKTKKLI